MNGRLDECTVCGTPTWCVTRADGRPQCLACRAEVFFDQVCYRYIDFRLLPWQREVIRSIYGTVDPETGERTKRRAYVSVPKKNGKSFLVGGMPLYHLVMEQEFNPLAYGAAAAREQAGLVFRAAAELVRASPILQKRLKVIESTKRIVRRDGSGSYQVISADGNVHDGVEPSLAIVDELHRWSTKRAETLHDVLVKGTISRAEPLVMQITTAGDVYESPLWMREYEHAKRVLRDSSLDRHLYVFIRAVDERKMREDKHYWMSLEARVEANPSHEAHGGFLRDERIVEELAKARNNPSEKYKYLRYHLNVAIGGNTDGVVPMDRWHEAPATRGIVGRECYGGLDLSWTTDLTGAVELYPDREGYYDVKATAWLPANKLQELEQRCHVPLSQWVEQGHLKLCEGDVINHHDIIDHYLGVREHSKVVEICYDRYNASLTVEELERKGFQCVRINQDFSHLSLPFRKMLELIQDGKLRHDKNPVLDWCMACLSSRGDGNDNIRPIKPDRRTKTTRVDLAVCIIMALARAMEQTGDSLTLKEGFQAV